jgi:hypothetical protein
MTILSMKKSPWLDVLGGGSDTIKESNQIDLYVMRNTSTEVFTVYLYSRELQ